MRVDQDALSDVCGRNEITRLRLFGSFLRDDAGDESDIDLLVDFAGRESLLDLVRIERELSEFFGRRVDLLTERALSPYLRDRILSEAQVVYERAA